MQVIPPLLALVLALYQGHLSNTTRTPKPRFNVIVLVNTALCQRPAANPGANGDAPLQATGEIGGGTLRYAQPNCHLTFSSPDLARRMGEGKGEIRVTEEKLLFVQDHNATSVAIDYPTIVIHAISRGENDPVARRPCIYCQLGSAVVVDERASELRGEPTAKATEDSDAEEEGDETCEMRIVPDDAESLDAIYQALSECATLHPDPDYVDEDENDGDAGAWMYSAQDTDELSATGQAALRHLESVFDGVSNGDSFTYANPSGDGRNANDKEQFEDAEEER
ncbi:hypothetical protein HK101_008915 [Irineochytrium annulatum]|nr:hypothetical protein HK101_008915 [Irineochytrium annulatum]